ncbi:uncharacterized protein LOC129907686 isoform X2 [Episyrphus balteatus]|uniref:uncharacterized protein LOC129907686 isoform X2 n=1 Tax=Episyrphus balteatus TaxID=286459 RepID=UPI002485B586|nr:uncharacterized protein LOC129907686 isoform X2 [Episyrphus balteatus]
MRFKQKFFSKMSFDNNSTSEEETLLISVSNFMQTIEAYSDSEFQSSFKMKRSTLDPLIVKYALSSFYPSHSSHGGGKQKIEAKKEVYLFACYLTSTGTFNDLANMFGIVKSTAWAAVGRVSNWLVSLGPEYIKWPQGDVVDQICSKFESKHQIPGVIGAIDCTHITIGSSCRCRYEIY